LLISSDSSPLSTLLTRRIFAKKWVLGDLQRDSEQAHAKFSVPIAHSESIPVLAHPITTHIANQVEMALAQTNKLEGKLGLSSHYAPA